MRHADVLADMRKQGRTDEQVIEILRALACSFHATDPTADALDACIKALEDNEESLQAVHELTLADMADWHRPSSEPGEYDAQTPSVHYFLTRAAA